MDVSINLTKDENCGNVDKAHRASITIEKLTGLINAGGFSEILIKSEKCSPVHIEITTKLRSDSQIDKYINK